MCNRSKCLIALLPALMLTSAQAAEPRAAVFDFEFADTSLEGATNGPRVDWQARLAWLVRNCLLARHEGVF